MLRLRTRLAPSKCCYPYIRTNRNASTTTTTTSTKPFYITTPIFYPNASPHIGHLYTLVAGDVFARYHRLRKGLPSNETGTGEHVHFLVGTDEHGLKIQKASQEHFGMVGREKEFCDFLVERFRCLGEKALISNTCFMRTTSQEHKRAVEDVWNQLLSKGYIYKANYSGWYSITDECFYTDSQVTTVAPASPSPSTTVSNPPETTQTISIETGSPVEWSEEENYIFRLSSFRNDLLQYYRSNPKSVYPQQYRKDTFEMLGEGQDGSPSLADISISRPRSRLEWGIQVPDDPSQTIYVWFDALLIYLTGSGYPWSSSSTNMGCWPADLQIIGKDILRFHAIYLPAILQALSAPPYSSKDDNSSTLGIPLSRTILAHAHWTLSQKKMSKSLGNVADPLKAIDKWGADAVRFYLMRIGGRWKDDVDWSTQQLVKHHREIQAQLGNYFLRITSPRLGEHVDRAFQSGEITMEDCFSESMKLLLRGINTSDKQQQQQQPPGRTLDDVDSDGKLVDPNVDLLKAVLVLPEKIHQHMETFEVGMAIKKVMVVLKLANKTLTDIAPWSPDAPPSLVITTHIVALETIRVVGACLEPIMPTVAGKLKDAFGLENLVLKEKDQMETTTTTTTTEQDQARVLWDRWTGRKIDSFPLFPPVALKENL